MAMAASKFPPLGTEEDIHGDTPDLWFFAFTGIMIDSVELVAVVAPGLTALL
jgi:hypothetical protein